MMALGKHKGEWGAPRDGELHMEQVPSDGKTPMLQPCCLLPLLLQSFMDALLQVAVNLLNHVVDLCAGEHSPALAGEGRR